MREGKWQDLELGNILFGNSRGLYKVEPRMEYQDVFCEFLNANGFDGYGYWHSVEDGEEHCEFSNEVFTIRPYYWGEDEEIAKLPNFVYKPTGLEIQWYKYPMRDAYSNQDISVEDFKKVLCDCERSMKSKEVSE